jgi:hypothetical protein
MTGIFHSSALPNDKNNQTSTRGPLHFADSATCTGLSETMDSSHDSANRFLLRESYTPADLFQEASPLLCLEGGTLSVDDTVLDKPYSQKMQWVGYFWSGKHHSATDAVYRSHPQCLSMADFIRDFMSDKDHLNPQFQGAVNA